MELEGDGDHLESVKRDSDSDPGLEEGKKIYYIKLVPCCDVAFWSGSGLKNGKNVFVKIFYLYLIFSKVHLLEMRQRPGESGRTQTRLWASASASATGRLWRPS